MILRLQLITALLCSGAVHAGSFDQAVKDILSVGREGKGNDAAAEAWQALSTSTSADLPLLVGSLHEANPLAANYLRAAIDALVERETAAARALPLAPLTDILLDPRAGDQSRSMAFDLLQRAAPEAAGQLIPGFLSDPNAQLRRLAVARLIAEATTADKTGEADAASLLYSQAMSSARDVDQIREVARALEKRGKTVDLPRQFGFLMVWDVIGPFDNTGHAGFDRVYPPEEGWKPDAVYDGKAGQVRWQPLAISDAYGKVDLNVPYTALKETVAYARAVFNSDKEQDVELRLGSKNAWKIWLNGQILFGRDEYHRGQRIDQYILPAKFRAGPNEILVKCCQNEQNQDWTVEWEFQLRICDTSGAAVLAPDRPPTPAPGEKRRRPASTN